MRTRFLPAALCAAAILFLPASAGASDTSYLSGDWGGKRAAWGHQGIAFDIGYTSEIAHNFTGGDASLTRYTDQWSFGSSLDLDALWQWHGMQFDVMVTERSGRNLGADANIGNNQLLQEVYGRGQTWHLTVFALRQQVNDTLSWRVGRLPVGEDFASLPCDFQNLTFCGAQPGNIVGDYWVNWPTSQWGAWMRVAKPTWYLQAGAYQVNPTYIDDRWARRNGWKLNNPSGTKGALMPLEFGWTPPNPLPGTFKLGAWYSHAGGQDVYFDDRRDPLGLTGRPPLEHDGRYGAYLLMRQQVTGRDAHHGVTVFFNASQDDRATSPTDRQLAMGMEYRAPFGRPNDMVGFALGATHANGRAAATQRLLGVPPGLVNDGYEYVTELFYGWSPAAWVTLRPNLQFVRHPGGAKGRDDAWVLGLKSGLVF